MKIFIIIMLMVSFNANAGWFGSDSKPAEAAPAAPKSLNAKEKAMVVRGICGCDVASNTMSPGVHDLLVQMNISLRKTYNIHGSLQCKGWDEDYRIAGRKACTSVYSSFGEDRVLKAQGESLK